MTARRIRGFGMAPERFGGYNVHMVAQVKSLAAQTSFAVAEAQEPAVLVRRSNGARNEHGEWVPADPVEINVQLVTAPTGSIVRESLPEGLRAEDLRSFWLRESVEAVAEGRTAGDIIRHRGKSYRVIRVDDWGAFRAVLGVQTDAA